MRRTIGAPAVVSRGPVPGIDVVQLSSRLLRSGTALPRSRRRPEPPFGLVPILLVAALDAAIANIDQVGLAGHVSGRAGWGAPELAT